MINDKEPATFNPPQPNAALVVGPKDHLVLTFPAGTSRQQFDEILAGFDDHPLKGRVLLVVGVEGAAVVQAAGS